MKIYLLRHAEREHGEKQDTLTKKGLVQARELKFKLGKFNVDKIYCSTSNRCKETIKPFLEEFNGEVEYISDLEEMRLGILQGKTAQKFRDTLKESGLDKDEFRPEGGENLEDFEIRIKNFISLLKNKDEKNILISTHAGVIKLFFKFLKNETITKPEFASISYLEI